MTPRTCDSHHACLIQLARGHCECSTPVKSARRGQHSYVSPGRDVFWARVPRGVSISTGASGHASVGVGVAHTILDYTEVIRAVILPTKANGLFFKTNPEIHLYGPHACVASLGA